MVRSPVSLEKATNDEKTSTEMELYEEDDVNDMDKKVIHEDQKALSGKHMHMKLNFRRNWLNCVFLRSIHCFYFIFLKTSILHPH